MIFMMKVEAIAKAKYAALGLCLQEMDELAVDTIYLINKVVGRG